MSFPPYTSRETVKQLHTLTAAEFSRLEALVAANPGTDLSGVIGRLVSLEVAIDGIVAWIAGGDVTPVPDPTPVPTPAPVPVSAQSFPLTCNLYSDTDQNSLVAKQKIARYGWFVSSLDWHPLPSSEGQPAGMTFGAFMKTLQRPGSITTAYWHLCLFDHEQAEKGNYRMWHEGTTGLHVAGRRYRFCPEWFLTYNGSPLTGDFGATDTQFTVADSTPFQGSRFAVVGREMVKVTGINGNALQVERAQNAQNEVPGGFPAVPHGVGAMVKPVAAPSFGDPNILAMNITTACPKADGGFGMQTFNEFSASLLALKLSEPALADLDGIFLDNAVERMIAIIDKADRTGVTQAAWFDGMKDHIKKLRERLGPGKILTANTGGAYRDFGQWLDGGMIEGLSNRLDNHFVSDTDTSAMVFTRNWVNGTGKPYTIVNASSPNGQHDPDFVRAAVAWACVLGAYIAIDEFLVGNNNAGLNSGGHQAAWWYGVYDSDLGRPTGAAMEVQPGLFRRDFERGIALVNTTGSTLTAVLGGTFNRFVADDDPWADGSARSRETLAAYGGAILKRAP